MATTKFRVPTPEECAFLRANKIDPDGVMVSLKSEDSMILLNLRTNEYIAIYPGPKSKREFPNVWK